MSNLSPATGTEISVYIENIPSAEGPSFCYGHLKKDDEVDFTVAENVRGEVKFVESSPFGGEKILKLTDQSIILVVTEDEATPKNYPFIFTPDDPPDDPSENSSEIRHHRLTLDNVGGQYKNLRLRFEEKHTVLTAIFKKDTISVVNIKNIYGSWVEFKVNMDNQVIFLGLDKDSSLRLTPEKRLDLSELKGPDDGQSGGTGHVEIVIEGVET